MQGAHWILSSSIVNYPTFNLPVLTSTRTEKGSDKEINETKGMRLYNGLNVSVFTKSKKIHSDSPLTD